MSEEENELEGTTATNSEVSSETGLTALDKEIDKILASIGFNDNSDDLEETPEEDASDTENVSIENISTDDVDPDIAALLDF